MKSRNLFLGLIIIFVGVIALLASIGAIDFSWRVAWRLWPMMLIVAGIAVLPLKEVWKALLLLATMALSVLLYQHEAETHKRHHWLFSQNEVVLQVDEPYGGTL